jgi:RNA polymerase sigma-54 factor
MPRLIGVRARRAHAPTAWPLTPEQLGRIVVARFLELPLRTFERRVRALEQAPRFQELLRDAVRIGSLSGQPSVTTRRTRGDDLLGVIQRGGDEVVWRYGSLAFDREYAFDEVVLGRLMARGDLELTRLVGRLRLVNTRNRLTHALVQTLIETQRDYVLSGDPLRLKLLSQAALSARIRARGTCPVDADPSRVSRLLRHLAVRLPDGDVVRLRSLCPVARDLHRRYVSWVTKQERVRMVEDRNLVPMTDREIAATVREEFGARLLTRTVAYIRRDLGIPGSRERARRSEYLSIRVGFSPVLSLTAETLYEQVPTGPGVYEIRRAEAPPGMCPIIYIGSARDLRKRLGDHLRGWSDNALLQAHARGGMRFRYRPVAARWRDFERAVYRAFCATFGTPPLANRMSP